MRAGAVRPVFTHFLDAETQQLFIGQLRAAREVEAAVFGGYEGADRAMLCLHPAGQPPRRTDFPIECLRIEDRGGRAPLGHRDYLGALMALGVRRELVGDVVADGTGAFVLCTGVMKELIVRELAKVGSHGVAVRMADPGEIAVPEHQRLRKNVSSMRFDCIVSAALGENRELSRELIEGGLVTLNHAECRKPARLLREGDIFSIRGKGKYRVGAVCGRSAKDRIFIEIERY